MIYKISKSDPSAGEEVKNTEKIADFIHRWTFEAICDLVRQMRGSRIA